MIDDVAAVLNNKGTGKWTKYQNWFTRNKEVM